MRAVIFDMDGLLVDSEPLWVRAEIEVFGHVGVILRPEDCALTKGLRTDDVIAYWHARRRWETPEPDVVESRLIARVCELVRTEGMPLEGVASAIAAAKKAASKIALASSSPTPIIHAVLERLGLAGAFDVVQSAESEPYGKPHPGIFLTTAHQLDVKPSECVVLEDSLAGVIAAKAARMTCIAVPDRQEAADPRFALADAKLASLDEVTAELLASIVVGRT